MQVVLVHGYPGSGKGTQCKLLAMRFNFKHISVGDLMRKEMKGDTADAKEIKRYVMAGKLVPAEMTLELLKKEMEKDDAKKFLIDGYPRNKEGLEMWQNYVKERGISVRFLLLLNCDREICIKRIKGQARGDIRPDDDDATVNKRMETYDTYMSPVFSCYEHVTEKIDGQGNGKLDTPEQVFMRVKKVFEKHHFRFHQRLDDLPFIYDKNFPQKEESSKTAEEQVSDTNINKKK